MTVTSEPPRELGAGRYHIVRLLGRGGMGEVYLARDQTLPREVAIKFITSDHAQDADARRRLIREAQAAAALDHPAICTVYDTGETPDGQPYIVMQYVDGVPLTEVLERGPLPVRDALTLSAEIAEALAAANAHGIVHRDLKPANVMITAGGRPKLVDFGIAKVFMASPSSEDDETASAVTRRGSIVGTVGYMSPEQAQQRVLDGRSDLFSLGAVLFELLTGRRAFTGATPVETLGNVLHVHPPAPSQLRPGLDERHDELCRRLLAKDPSDRFKSAEQAVGAIRLLIPDSSRTALPIDTHGHEIPGPRAPRRYARWVAGLLILLSTVAGVTWWLGAIGLRDAPEDAEIAYRRGTDALREGAYYKASNALEDAVRIFPGYVLAYARLAEARAELDDQRAAQASLLKIQLPWGTPKEERLRVDAIKALVLRDVDRAIGAYRQLALQNPGDAGAWLDLGRAQESAGLRPDARASYERAVKTSPDYAPAYVRLGYMAGLESRQEEALAAFAQAERLYQSRLDVEGLTEVLLRRGAMHDSFTDLKAARADIERALSLATEVNAPYQQLRARLALSSVTASEGKFAEAIRTASAAIQDALTQRLETVAADGLIDLASLMQSPFPGTDTERAERLKQAEAHAQRAAQLAEQQGAARIAARAKVQLAAIYNEQRRPADALALVSTVLPFLQENRYRRFELLGLSIASRAHLALDDLEQARQISSTVLDVAQTVKDEAQIALATSNLASVDTALGNYPEALRLRRSVEEIRVRQADEWSIPYDLGNRADLLIRMGRNKEAGEALDALEAGIAAKKEAYLGRKRHATYYRAFAAVTSGQCNEALKRLGAGTSGATEADVPGILGAAIARFCQARAGRRVSEGPVQTVDAGLRREQYYWIALSALQLRDWPFALSEAQAGLDLLARKPNDELRWRLAAVGAVAARELGNRDIVAPLSDTMRSALQRLQAQWGADFAAYGQRKDLLDLRNWAEQR